jgi:S-adenosylmethionine decarboxylase
MEKNIPGVHPYGKHLIIDAYGITASKLQDYAGLKKLLTFLPGYMGMSTLHPAVVKKVQSPDYPDWGVSGFTMLYESHISLHTWPEVGYVSMDVYSCKEFDDKKVVAYIKNMWAPSQMKLKVVKRKNYLK